MLVIDHNSLLIVVVIVVRLLRCCLSNHNCPSPDTPPSDAPNPETDTKNGADHLASDFSGVRGATVIAFVV